MNTINRSDLVAAVAHKTGESPATAKRIVDALTNEIACRLVDGDDVNLKGFGRFRPVSSPGKINNLPHALTTTPTPKTRIKFIAGAVLSQILNQPTPALVP